MAAKKRMSVLEMANEIREATAAHIEEQKGFMQIDPDQAMSDMAESFLYGEDPSFVRQVRAELGF